jgi:glycosyltransferase involved in cell wall biosynthesis
MKISIVTISYNQGRFVEDAIQSVLTQNVTDLEYIIVDPGSEDASRKIIMTYASQLGRVILEPDAGPADGLNKGFNAATGDVFGYINADDFFLPNVLRSVEMEFANRPDVDVVYGNSFIIDQSKKVLRRAYSDNFNLGRYMHGGVLVMQQSTFFRASAFREVGGFNTANHTCWDGELLVDFAVAGKKFRRVNLFWSAFRLHEASISGSGSKASQYENDLLRMFRKVYGRDPSMIDKTMRLCARVEKWVLNPRASGSRLMDELRSSARKIAL